jgi:hypothetical protein
MQKVSYALKDLYSWLDNMVRLLRMLACRVYGGYELQLLNHLNTALQDIW